MILLDTNVISEVMKSTPDPSVMAWLNAFPADALFVSSLTQADAQIASVARSHGALLATRNIKDFLECGLDLVNPWE
ncbi:motility twitching protein PilT [Pararhodospirillum photometricum]|uniref:PilT protein domain protein n=1 Tax=Pararhodospirillum photometricum DSM 122 TaxID=1150469 RepID=H6SLC8_PARPM|nr:motility twitching protein PilT [Pararhodospirillum photometricum]CCG08793.1 PilT protein domain protein [Pararhodospirillum photometricum DSM 122]